MIYISYFDNLSNIDLDRYKVLMICNQKPDSIIDPRIKDLGYIFEPEEPLLTDYKSGIINEQQYETIYLSWLEYNKSTIANVLFQFVLRSEKPCVLLSYEKPQDFGYHKILAKWLFLAFGFMIKEL